MNNYKPANFNQVKFESGLWHERLDTILAKTIPSQYKKLKESGILGSLDLPQPMPELTIPRSEGGFTTQIFWDSDVGKWIEAASFALSHRRDEKIIKQIEEITDQLEAAQADDGYLNCWYLGREPEKRWTNLRDNHELYNAGHLIEGAVAYYHATGSRRLISIFERYIDHIAELFGADDNQRPGYPGHQEIELALVKLYHITGNKKHLDLASYFIDQRGSLPHYFETEMLARGDTYEQYHFDNFEYSQSHLPVREQTQVLGHAVRAIYMYTAMADLYMEQGDESLKKTCEILWQDVTETRMYITGGFGPSKHNEGFTTEYDLPNDTAYAETCASVAMIFWAQRMLNIDLDGQYADVLELALYNNTLAGISTDGTQYFYDNKLESDGTQQRWDWHPCPCCTMNVSRLVASVSGYFYSTNDHSLAVHLYGGNSANLQVGDCKIYVRETSNYPWSGNIKLELSPEFETNFSLKLRIPGWAKNVSAKLNGETVQIKGKVINGYLSLDRQWQKGDVVELDLPMPAERIYANPNVKFDLGRVAIRRGPMVYCIEQADNKGLSLEAVKLPRGAEIKANFESDLLNGITILELDAVIVDDADWQRDLYRTVPPAETPTKVKAIPYYSWCNRGSNKMFVWIKE